MAGLFTADDHKFTFQGPRDTGELEGLRERIQLSARQPNEPGAQVLLVVKIRKRHFSRIRRQVAMQ